MKFYKYIITGNGLRRVAHAQVLAIHYCKKVTERINLKREKISAHGF
jgi:hypothetical protein